MHVVVQTEGKRGVNSDVQHIHGACGPEVWNKLLARVGVTSVPDFSVFLENDAPSDPFQLEKVHFPRNRNVCSGRAGQAGLHRNVCGWPLPTLPRFVATGCLQRLGAASGAGSSAVPLAQCS